MNWLAFAAIVLACAATGAASTAAAALAAADNPAIGSILDGVYDNSYFGLRYSLPQGWTEGAEGPTPSERGYYVLDSFRPKGALTGTVLIAAQDMFFAAQPDDDAAAMTRRFSASLRATDGVTVVGDPRELVIAGHRFIRVDFAGAGLSRAMLVTELRCHLVSFNVTTGDPALLPELVRSVANLTLDGANEAATPICVKDYASDGTLLHRVEPVAVGPRFARIPVRFVIGADGLVGPIHVIRATPEQRQTIENALRQWRFKPHLADGVARAVETGLLFEFPAPHAGPEGINQ